MSKRLSSQKSSQSKRSKVDEWNVYLHETLQESGLILKRPPQKCVTTQETIHVIRNIKKNLQKHFEYPRNVIESYSSFEKECHDLDTFRHYLYPNIIRISDDDSEHPLSDSVVKILLSVPIFQKKMLDFILEKAIELAAESKCGPWIQIILKSISTLDSIADTEKLSSDLINLLDVSSEKMVRLEIIPAIPDIIGDQEHHNIAAELSRFLTEDHDLIPAILDCLSHLFLSEDQFLQLQKKSMDILMTLTKCHYFPNFIKFLLMPGRMSDASVLETVHGLRSALGWSPSMASVQEIASSQVLTATAIRNSMLSSKVVASAWLKAISSCKECSDHKPIDFVILLIMYSLSEDKQKQVDNLIRKQIKVEILKEDFLEKVFDDFKPILKDYMKFLLEVTNSLLKTKSDPIMESFASQIYMLMFAKLDDCGQTLIAELLQLSLYSKQCVMVILQLLNNVALKNMALLKPQSIQMLTLLDRMHNMSLNEIRAVMNLVCGLAFTYENSVIRDDLHIIIKKELGSSNPKIKIQGILAGIHAVKYLMVARDNEDDTMELPDDISYSSVNHLSEGSLREAAQIIELISRSIRQYPDMIAFFYDELSKIIFSASYINKHFIAWLSDAVTNDLQQNFIIGAIENDKIGDLNLSFQYCLNTEGEMDEVIAINIGGLTLQGHNDIDIGILSPLFQLVQTLHYKRHEGDLTSIDALLGCPIVMPKFDIDLIDDLDNSSIGKVLDCLVHCANWFRELLNGFATQNDEALKIKILNRVLQIQEIETIVRQILIKTKINYKPPICTFNLNKYTGEHFEKRPVKMSNVKQKVQKKNAPDDTVLPETIKSQATQPTSFKNKLETIQMLPYRQLTLNLIELLNINLSNNNDEEVAELTIKSLNFILKNTNTNLESILVSKIKKKTFLSKADTTSVYDPNAATQCAKTVSTILPKIMQHLQTITVYIDNRPTQVSQNESGFLYTSEMIDYLTGLEYIYNTFSIYFNWLGFKNSHNQALFKSSLRTLASGNENQAISLKDMLLAAAKYLQKHECYCLQLSTAISLIEIIKAIQEISNSTLILKILRNLAQDFLSREWRTPDGIPEKGLIFNQSIDKLANIYFINNEILTLKQITMQLSQDIQMLKSRSDTLGQFKCINKSNFPILYRNIGTAVFEATKKRLDKGLTNSEHIELWKEVASTLKYMSDIAKTQENRNNLSAFFKKSLPVLKLFLSNGIPILEIQFKNSTEEILEILKILQQSTRFLQSLCCHSRLKKDTVLLSNVPYMRQLLETLIYKVKAVLAANKCSEAFWMGNLKNKDIHGEVIATQQSVVSEESLDDCDDQLPEDDSDDTDDDMLNPDSRSVSDIV